LAIAAVLGTLAILFGQYHTVGRVAGTTLLTAIAAGLMIPISLLLDKPNGRSAGLLGMSVILTEFFLSITLIWDLTSAFPGRKADEHILFTMLILALVAPAAMLFLGACAKPVARIAGLAGVGLSAVTFGLCMIATWQSGNIFHLGTENWFASAGVVA